MTVNHKLEQKLSLSPTSLLGSKSEIKKAIPSRITMIPLSLIESNPIPCRKRYDEVAILALADSIRRHGLLQPILVKKLGSSLWKKPRYVCLVGERRLRAFSMLSCEEIPCFVVSDSSFGRNELSLVENLLRSDLDMFESATALLLSCVAESLSLDLLASRLSTSQKNVANKIALTQLSNEEQAFALKNCFTERQVHALLRVHDEKLRQKLAEVIAEHGYGDKRTEEYIDSILCQTEKSLSFESSEQDVCDFVEELNKELISLQKKGFVVAVDEFEQEDDLQLFLRISKKKCFT